MFKFVEFTGEEAEKEFLEKCVRQWEISTNNSMDDGMKLIELATVFTEMRNRIDELG